MIDSRRVNLEVSSWKGRGGKNEGMGKQGIQECSKKKYIKVKKKTKRMKDKNNEAIKQT